MTQNSDKICFRFGKISVNLLRNKAFSFALRFCMLSNKSDFNYGQHKVAIKLSKQIVDSKIGAPHSIAVHAIAIFDLKKMLIELMIYIFV